MSQERSRLVSAIRTLCGEPPDIPVSEGGLPTELIFEEIVNVEAELLRDLDLSSNNSRVASHEVNLGDEETEFSLSTSDFHAASYAYLQTDPSSQIWWPVEIVSHSSVLDMANEGKLAIAFSGTPTMAYVSWIPSGTQTLKIWYERSGDENPTMSGSTELGISYDAYLKTQVAAICLEQHLKQTLGDVLKMRLAKSERQWQKYINKGRQQGTGAKSRVFTPPRWRPRLPYVDRTRFFVP